MVRQLTGDALGAIRNGPRQGGAQFVLLCAPLLGDDVDDVLRALLELHDTVGESEQGVILATADVLAGGGVGATLANDDLAGLDGLTAGYSASSSVGRAEMRSLVRFWR